ncbi:MAG: hypothetical protein LBS23_01305, partial [Holosporaceae bacterium]|nr:hypothetical protein [Holosporaceae bacterium]
GEDFSLHPWLGESSNIIADVIASPNGTGKLTGFRGDPEGESLCVVSLVNFLSEPFGTFGSFNILLNGKDSSTFDRIMLSSYRGFPLAYTIFHLFGANIEALKAFGLVTRRFI